jgi:hypothetical protein
MASKTRESHHASTKHKGHAGGKPSITAKNLWPEEKEFLEKHQSCLSRSTLRAKWIHSADEKADRPGQTLATRSHEVIRKWAEERGGVPATTGNIEEGERPRVLRFNFPDFGGSSLKEIDWDAWFGTFDQRKLVFLFQETKRDGAQSNFFRLDSPERENG